MKDSAWGSRLSPVPLHWKIVQVCMADQAMYHEGDQSVFVGGRLWALLAPAAIWKKENCRSFTSIQMLHAHTIPRTTLSHTIPRTQPFTHTHTHTFCHTRTIFHTHTRNFVTHNLSYTALSHTIFHTDLCHTRLLYIHFFTQIFHTILSRTLTHNLSHTIYHTQLPHAQSFTHNLMSHIR